VFVRAEPSENGAVVTFGGLARTDASGGFEDEFAELARELRDAYGNQPVPSGGTTLGTPGGVPDEEASASGTQEMPSGGTTLGTPGGVPDEEASASGTHEIPPGETVPPTPGDNTTETGA
jgi:hypothetical protein